jgi:hypothetical protein
MKRTLFLTAAVVFAMDGSLVHASPAASWAKSASHSIPPITLRAPRLLVAPGTNGIVGTWLASYDGGVHVGYLQWQKGGTLQDMMDFGPKTGNVQFGDWSTDGRGTYTALLTGWTYDDKGNTRTGSFVKTEDDIPSGDTYSGTFEVTYYDLNGNITFQHDGTVSATRIENQ